MIGRMTIGLALAALAWPTPEAHGKILIINTGEGITLLGDARFPQEVELPPDIRKFSKVGYVYQRFGIFWVDMWRWGGEYCLYDGDHDGGRITPADAAEFLGVPEDQLPKPFWYRFPPGILVGAVIVVCIIAGQVSKARKKKEIAGLTGNADYENAIAIYRDALARQDEPPAESDDQWTPKRSVVPDEVKAAVAFRQGVDYLVSVGVPEARARENLAAMVGYKTPEAG